MTSRIPAWKKLGLQLKNSATSAIETDTASHATSNTFSPSKGIKKRPLGAENEEPNVKKQRVENSTINDKPKREDAKGNINGKILKKKASNLKLKSSIEPSPVEQQDDKPASETKSKKRKSVSFAEDTKSEDGDADVELHLEQEDEDDHEPSLAAASKAERKKLKRERRAKTRPTPASSTISPTTPTDPVLQYLTLYHKSRAQWKFQKNRETHLLKHALSVDRIPSTYNASLAAYLAGIKGEGAKKRVAEVAVEAIKADDAAVDSEKDVDGGDASQQDVYRNSISSFRKMLAEQGADPHSWEGDMVGDEATDLNADWVKRLEKRRRAELVRHFVGGSIPTIAAAEFQQQQKPAVSKKKKKNRTVVVEDTSSSGSSSSESDSDSDSDTDSDSDSESDVANSKPATKQVNGTKSTIDHEASSSSESKSSSDSSSGSDSGSETSSDSSSDSGNLLDYLSISSFYVDTNISLFRLRLKDPDF
ncbi:hypothetical protein GX51_03731 [Blastomyces parvus]|uniref:WKF domain-containing protein n=1 Tax=Blastomyces parvus TaxID=2060905 RepID=A0A2B7X5K3_9EURO|nr:hypothetical protein GX51_03731 [Blastomyces parvus]